MAFGQSRNSRDHLSSYRENFVISYTLTLATVALLLITTFSQLEAQDLGQARRVLVAPDVAIGESSGNSSKNSTVRPVAEQISLLQSSTNAPVVRSDPLPISNSPDLVHLETTSKSPRSTLLPNDFNSTASSFRQTRATTRKRITTSSTTSTIPPSSTITEIETITTTEQPPSSKRPPVDPVDEDKIIREKNKKTQPRPKQINKLQENLDLGDDELDDVADTTEAEREQARRRRMRHRHRKLTHESPTSTINATTLASETVSTSKAPSQTSWPSETEQGTRQSTLSTSMRPPGSSTTESRTTGAHNKPPSHSATKIASSSLVPATSVEPLRSDSKMSSSKRANASLLDHEYYDDYYDDEYLLSKESETTRKPVDLSKVKLVDLSHWNETSTTTNRTAMLTPSSNAANTSTTSSPSETKIGQMILPTTSAPIVNDMNAIEMASSNTNSSLDARSPSTSLGRQISKIILDQKNKLLRPMSSTPSTTTPAPSSKFSQTRPPTMTTTLASLTITTTRQPTPTNQSMFVQVINQTETTKDGLPPLSSNTSNHLDWSKLVKVVFKSAKDNHTIYTVVMNSSELSDHPINDWSNELPKLLQRDFEKLVKKWANVFPIDHLMGDLSRIIANKSSNISLSQALMDKLNETHPIKAANTSTMVETSPVSSVNQTSATNTITTTIAPILMTSQKPFVELGGALSDGIRLMANKTSNTTGEVNSSHHQPLINVTRPSNFSSFASTQPTSATIGSDFPLPSNSSSLNVIGNNTLSQFNVTTGMQSDDFNAGLKSASMSTSSPNPLNLPTDYIKTTTPWSSSADLSTLASNAQQNQGLFTTTTMAPINISYVTVGQTIANGSKSIYATGRNVTSGVNTTDSNKTIVDIMQDLRDEQTKIEDNVKEQGSSLRHFIIICSISVVLATSIVVALIVLLFK